MKKGFGGYGVENFRVGRNSVFLSAKGRHGGARFGYLSGQTYMIAFESGHSYAEMPSLYFDSEEALPDSVAEVTALVGRWRAALPSDRYGDERRLGADLALEFLGEMQAQSQNQNPFAEWKRRRLNRLRSIQKPIKKG